MHLPVWAPEGGELAGPLEGGASYAARLGLATRPARDTVADTWAWVQAEGMPAPRLDRPRNGLPEDLERVLLSSP